MFERYNVDDLFLGLVHVIYAGIGSYSYWTVLKKSGEEGYIDLQSMETVEMERNSSMTSYVAGYMEPFRNFYYKKGAKNTFLSRRRALSEGKRYYDETIAKYFPCPTNETPKQRRLDFRATSHNHVQY